ncbi:MAG: site-specific DNA-methyltransferase [Candidatus Thorarchaeota archaeon]
MEPLTNIIYKGDCLNAIEVLYKTHQNKIRLIYIDPPFFSGTDYTLKRKTGSSAEKAPSLQDIITYSDKWTGGLEEYLEFMRERLESMRPLITENGSLWIHLDWHVSHYIKIIMDEIFGYSNFINEIIWKRTNSPKAQSRGFGSQHDVILVYAKDRTKFRTNPVYREHDERSLKPYSYSDEKGRFRLIEIEAQGIQRTEDRKQFKWKGRTAPYLYRKETLDEWWDSGIIYTSKNGRYTKKQYLSDIPGVIVSDLWLDIPPIQGSSKEYIGFLTQKPLKLLKRIIETATSPGDIVSDFFGGSGTTAVAASQTSRNWIVCDSSIIAIDLIVSRLEKNTIESSYEIIDLAS